MLDDKAAIVAQASSPVSICLARSQLRRKAPLGGPLANQEFESPYIHQFIVNDLRYINA